jgi:hypothetical protein
MAATSGLILWLSGEHMAMNFARGRCDSNWMHKRKKNIYITLLIIPHLWDDFPTSSCVWCPPRHFISSNAVKQGSVNMLGVSCRGETNKNQIWVGKTKAKMGHHREIRPTCHKSHRNPYVFHKSYWLMINVHGITEITPTLPVPAELLSH